MDDDLIAQFTAITNAPPDKARQYLQISEGELAQAIELFFTNDGADLVAPSPSASAAPAPPPVPTQTRPRQSADELIDLDDDEDANMMDAADSDDEPQITEVRPREPALTAPPPPPQPSGHADDDEAMARRLQEELYAGGDMRGPPADADAEGYRAPIARTHETLVGPGEGFDASSPEEMRALVMEQMRQRSINRQRGTSTAPRPLIWHESPER